jgi:hypothetical protein
MISFYSLFLYFELFVRFEPVNVTVGPIIRVSVLQINAFKADEESVFYQRDQE